MILIINIYRNNKKIKFDVKIKNSAKLAKNKNNNL